VELMVRELEHDPPAPPARPVGLILPGAPGQPSRSAPSDPSGRLRPRPLHRRGAFAVRFLSRGPSVGRARPAPSPSGGPCPASAQTSPGPAARPLCGEGDGALTVPAADPCLGNEPAGLVIPAAAPGTVVAPVLRRPAGAPCALPWRTRPGGRAPRSRRHVLGQAVTGSEGARRQRVVRHERWLRRGLGFSFGGQAAGCRATRRCCRTSPTQLPSAAGGQAPCPRILGARGEDCPCSAGACRRRAPLRRAAPWTTTEHDS